MAHGLSQHRIVRYLSASTVSRSVVVDGVRGSAGICMHYG
jgi:hypothetical protein